MDVETCRFCARSNTMDYVNIFSNQGQLQSELNFVISEIKAWNLNISPNDGLSQSLCSDCFSKFKTINSFRQDCLQTQQMLRNTSFDPNINKYQDTRLQLEQSTYMLESANRNNLITQADSTILQDMIIENGVAESILVPPDMTMNYKISFDENVPTNIVIENEGLLQYSTSNGVDYINSASTQHSNNSNNDNKANNLDFEAQDLEEMLTGSIIPKNIIKNTPENHVVKKKRTSHSKLNDFSDLGGDETNKDEVGDDEDAFDEKPADRIADFPFACNYCYCPLTGSINHLVFKTSDALSQHFFDVHDPKSPYPCPKCPRLFVTNRSRNVHVSRVHNQKSQQPKCPYCRLVVRIPMEDHIINCTFKLDWVCNICSKEFRQTPAHVFRAHQRGHLSKKFRCEICDRVFMRRPNYDAHMKSHMQKYEPKPTHTCGKCKETFASKAELKEHELSEHDGKVRFQCEPCDRGFTSLAFLQRHMANLHSVNDSNQAICTDCGETFPSKLKLYFHQQRPKDENGQCIPIMKQKSNKMSCQHCSKRFTNRNQLEHHLETHDARLRPYACDKCNVRCRTEIDLKQHINFAHCNSNAFTCDDCDERFVFKKDLENHRLYHSKLTFRCKFDTCKAFYTRQSELDEHVQDCHEAIPCEYCCEVFSRSALREHQSSGICLVNPELTKMNGITITDDHFNLMNGAVQQNDTNDNNLGLMYTTNNINGNVCVQFVNEQQNQPIVFNNDDDLMGQPTETHQDVLEFLQAAADADVPLNDDDFFISSLLDPDNEIVVT